jgi:hypothetical protein
MGKIIKETHITGDKGVATFHSYCTQHKPYILWRPETVNDFGIDGEVELAATNSDNKLEATGEILKVQLKSTLKGSYIHKETDTSFEFHADQRDMSYWNRHKLAVLLVVYDDSRQRLYCKKVTDMDVGLTRTNQAIIFDKKDNLLETGVHNFTSKYSNEFKQRINYDITEEISINLFKFSILPNYIYEFDSKVSKASEIFAKFPSDIDRPIFAINAKKIYTFSDPGVYQKFCSEIIAYDKNQSYKQVFKTYFNDVNKRRIIVELLNQHIRYIFYQKKIGFNGQYKRFYFLPEKDQQERKIVYNAKSGKRDSVTRTVVTYKKYGKDSFYRHNAFEIKYTVIEGQLYGIINPQYLFTSDGKNPLEDTEKITKFTNYLTSREFNQQVLNHIHAISDYITGRDGKISICEIEDSIIRLAPYNKEKVKFGIPLDNNETANSQSKIEDNQLTIF